MNLIPIIGKADTLTPEECHFFKTAIREELAREGIETYDFATSVVPSATGDVPAGQPSDLKAMKARQPFAVCTSNKTLTRPDGSKVGLNGNTYA